MQLTGHLEREFATSLGVGLEQVAETVRLNVIFNTMIILAKLVGALGFFP